MLLPQSSAFAALKNRLNSVSAIGYLHIVPRAYTSPPFKRLTIANPTGKSRTSATSYERPTRLKGRGDEIKWIELLDKFKSVQERARRQQMQYNTTNGKTPGGGATTAASATNMASGMGGIGGIVLGATASILSPSRTSTPAGSATNAAGTNATKGRGGGGGNAGRLAAPAARRGRKG